VDTLVTKPFKPKTSSRSHSVHGCYRKLIYATQPGKYRKACLKTAVSGAE